MTVSGPQLSCVLASLTEDSIASSILHYARALVGRRTQSGGASLRNCGTNNFSPLPTWIPELRPGAGERISAILSSVVSRPRPKASLKPTDMEEPSEISGESLAEGDLKIPLTASSERKR